jgi:hypothetical protein
MSIQIFTTCNPIIIGCRLFRNNGRTIPTTEGIYFDGTTCWGVDPDGYVISVETCATTTTTSTTTTTTTASGFYYTVDQQDCSNSCAFVDSLVAFSTNSLTNGVRYNIGDGYVYQVVGSTSGPSYDVDLTGAPGNTNCNIACGL